MGFILTTLLRTLAQDIPLIITGFICMYIVFVVYLPKTGVKQKVGSIFLIEMVEHIILPFLLLITLLFTGSWVSALIFHLILLSFLFLFIGFVIVKAKTKEDWFRITAVAGFAYFFIFVYPFILIYIQLYSNISGWILMEITIFIFFLIYLIRIENR